MGADGLSLALTLATKEANRLSVDEEARNEVSSRIETGEIYSLVEAREWGPGCYDGHKAQVAMLSVLDGYQAMVLVESVVPDECTGEEPRMKTLVLDYKEALWFARAILRLVDRVKDERGDDDDRKKGDDDRG